ncbi:uncharacterized protein LOC134533136 isoform X2 [Bacillus rossius redtenbacheri]|uniref:uncharacterized protein LOC134533136 isoform X2 n=1 Tax=Bacillus rossius redtenbacheri TaxID=93214 RepID=UPI002FDECB87
MDVPVNSLSGGKGPPGGGGANNNPVASGSGPGLAKTQTPRSSTEDLSEYTDADESVSSAPTEFLAEFLSALMMKDYENALKYCKLILQYEPHNVTAKEFYPLIQEKIKLLEEAQETSSSREDSNGNDSSDGEEKRSSGSDSEATTASYSSLEDEEADDNAPPSLGLDPNGNSGVPATAKSAMAAGDSKGAVFQSTSSDSESPTEPITQPLTEPLAARQTAKPMLLEVILYFTHTRLAFLCK